MGLIAHQYLRPVKAARRQAMLDKPFLKRESLQTQTVDHATIFPLRDLHEPHTLFGRGGVVDASGEYVPLSALPNRVEGIYAFTSQSYRDEKVVYCGYLVPQWGHFLVEGVTRLWYFLEQDPTIDRYVFILEENENREIQGNYREYLKLLGIWDKLEFITAPTTFRQVVIPEISYQCGHYYSQQFLDTYERVAANVSPDPSWNAPAKIYFSRNQFLKFGAQDEFGHDLLDNFFEINGYQKFHPEKLTLSQMIYLLRNSQEVASLSGSSEHNILFAHSGQNLLVLERWVFNDDHQVDIDRIRSLNATYIDVNIPLYTTDFGGPYIVGYSESLQKFATDNGFSPPDPQFLSEKYRKNCFAAYMQRYWERYRYGWFMEDWYSTCTDYLWEGYQSGYAYFQDYLEGRKPFLTRQYFSLYYIKRNVKFILNKLGLYHS